MSFGKASRIPGAKDRLRKHQIKIKDLEALYRNRNTPRAVAQTASSGSSASGSTGGGTGDFLPVSGGTMVGNIAHTPKLIIVNAGRVDLDPGGNPPENSSYILVTGQGSPDDIKFIDGAERNGQQLIYQGTNQQIQYIKNANLLNTTSIVGDGSTNTITVTLPNTGTLANGDTVNVTSAGEFTANDVTISNLIADTSFEYDLGTIGSTTPVTSGFIQDGNIITPDGNNVLLDGTLSSLNAPTIELLFDNTIPAGGGWRVKGNPQFPSSATLLLDGDQTTDGVVVFDENNISGGGIVDEGNGIFRVRGSVYTLESHLRIDTITASGGELLYQWERADDVAFTTNVTSIGTIGHAFSVNEQNQTTSSQPFLIAEVDASEQDFFVRLNSSGAGQFDSILASGSSSTIVGIRGGVGGGGTGGSGISFPILYPKEDLEPDAATNATIDINENTGNAKQIQFPAGDIGLQIIGDPTNLVGQDVYVMFIQDDMGGRSLTVVDSTIKNGSLMDDQLDKAADAKTMFRLATLDGGLSYHAILVDLTTSAGGTLTALAIDTDKDWAGRFITNMAGISLFANSQANSVNFADHISFISDLNDSRGQVGRSEFFSGGYPQGLGNNIMDDDNWTVSVDTNPVIQLDASATDSFFVNSGKTPFNTRFEVNTTDVIIHSPLNLNMDTGSNISAGGGGEGVSNLGQLIFVDNIATPAAALAIFSDGTNLIANTGGLSGNLVINPVFENLVMGNFDITSSAGNGMTSIGHLDFIDNLATPAATFSIFSDGTDLFANTGTRTLNLDLVPETDANETISGSWTFTNAINTFNGNIVGGGSGDGMSNIGQLTFVDNAATPVGFAIFSNGTDLFANTGSRTLNLDLVPETSADETITGNWTFNENIITGGAGDGVTNIGHLDFIDNNATPAAALSIYSNGTDLFANTGGGVVNFSDIVPQSPWLSSINAAGNSLNNLLSVDIEDSAGATKLSISGPLGVGARFAFVSGDSVFFTENITDRLQINANGISLLGNDIAMGTGGNISAGGATEGMSNIGQLTFVDNTATPTDTFAIFSDGTDLFANTGTKTVNLDALPLLDADETVTGLWTFSDNIVAGGATLGMTTIGHLDFVDNTATPAAAFSIYSDGTDLLANTGGGVVNFSDIGSGSQTPWLQPIVADGNNLTDIPGIEFRDANNNTISGTQPYINFDNTNLIYNVPSGDFHVFGVAGSTKVNISTTGLTLVNGGDIAMGLEKIRTLGTPTVSTDAATKQYVDDNAGDIDGIQDANIWTDHETTQFDFKVFLSNSKQGREFLENNPLAEDDTINFLPIYLGKRARLVEFGFNLFIAPGSNISVQFGLYSNRTDGQNYPQTRLVTNSSTIGGTTAGAKTIFASATDLEAGLYWIALLWTSPDNLTISTYENSAANSAGAFLNTTLDPDQFLPILGYAEVSAISLPFTAPNEMAVISLNAAAVFARFIPIP